MLFVLFGLQRSVSWLMFCEGTACCCDCCSDCCSDGCKGSFVVVFVVGTGVFKYKLLSLSVSVW